MMIKLMRILVFAFVAALTGISAVAVINAGYVIPGTAPVIEVIHFVEEPRMERPEPQPQEEPEGISLLCMSQEGSRPPYPYTMPGWYLEMEKILERRMTANFDETPASEALRFVSDLIGINIIVSPEVDTESTVTLRVRQIKAKNLLSLILECMDDLSYTLKPEGVYISYDLEPSARERINRAIREAYFELRKEHKYRQFLEILNSPQEHEFDWTGKSSREALLQVCKTWGLPLNHSCCRSCSLNLEAPRGRWNGNAAAAMERALDNVDFSYVFDADLNCIDIVRSEQARTRRYWDSIGRTAFNRFKSKALGFSPAGMKLNDMVKEIENRAGILVIPDRRSWEKDITINLTATNPTLGDLIEHLEREYRIVAWYSMNFEVNSSCYENALVLFSEDNKNLFLCSTSE